MTPLQRRDPPPWLPVLSSALREALPRLGGVPPDPRLAEVIDALTRALERGDLAIDLLGPAPEGISAEHWPDAHRKVLKASPLCRPPHGPLAMEGSLVRWRRWHQLRREVLDQLLGRAQRRTSPDPADPVAGALDAQQRLAVQASLERDLVVLAGGPGTGKTSTVLHILEAFAGQRQGASIHLAAPTGKAAARLRGATGHRWPCATLHQLLESRGNGEFRRNRERPMAVDLLVVDEVSMVDLELMGAVLRALPDQARLVLVGDPAQLPPVAPGMPLQDLLAEDLREAMEGAVVTLHTTYRNAGAIAAVASTLRGEIQAGDSGALHDSPGWLAEGKALETDANLHWQKAPPSGLPAAVREALKEHLRKLGEASRACSPGTEDGWQTLAGLRDQLLVLTPRYGGPWGVEAVHRELLGSASATLLAEWPGGTPVLCTRNLHDLALSNGDLGVLVGAGEDRWLVFGQDHPLWLHPWQLNGALEPALALTVHKAQGSEAAQVMILLPEPEAVDLRLLYTALTRARQEAWLLTPER